MRISLSAWLAAFAISFAPTANAANAIVTTSLNLRTGPGTQYPVLGTIPKGYSVGVAGCVAGYGWCRVGYAGLEGWAASRYIAIPIANGYTNTTNFAAGAAAVGIPLIAGMIIGSAMAPGPRYDPHRKWHNGPRRYPPHVYGPGDRWKPRPRY